MNVSRLRSTGESVTNLANSTFPMRQYLPRVTYEIQDGVGEKTQNETGQFSRGKRLDYKENSWVSLL